MTDLAHVSEGDPHAAAHNAERDAINSLVLRTDELAPEIYEAPVSSLEWRWAVPEGSAAIALQARALGSDDVWTTVNYPSTALTPESLADALSRQYTDGEGSGFRFYFDANTSTLQLQTNFLTGDFQTILKFNTDGTTTRVS